MDSSNRHPDEPVEAPVSPPELFPLVGLDKTPTPEQLLAGRHGNGAWDLTDASVERAYAEVHQAKRADQDERRKFFHEEAKDGLLNAIRFHNRIIDRGHRVMDAVEAGETVSRDDMAILKMAQISSRELADRGVGRSAAGSADSETVTSVLALIERKSDAQ